MLQTLRENFFSSGHDLFLGVCRLQRLHWLWNVEHFQLLPMRHEDGI